MATLRQFILCASTLLCMAYGKQLRLLCMQPMTGNSWPGGAACLAPIEMALKDVHAHPNLLEDYNITYDIADSEVK